MRYEGGVDAVRGVSFSLEMGDSLAVVGESGSGKTSLALCLAGLVQPPLTQGSVRLVGQEMLGASPELLRSLRWSTVAIALQGAPFNPVVTVGDQVAEPLRERLGLTRDKARRQAEELAIEVSLDPDVLARHPHQLSGGERRRATLAMVLALDPELVVLDEPTAGLDPATSRDLMQRVAALAAARGFALVVVSHDLAHATRLTRRTMVIYAGEAMEVGPTARVVGEPTHPYSWALIGAYPVMTTTKDLRPIRGTPPDPRAVPAGCPYHPRCTQAESVCVERRPPFVSSRGRQVLCHFGGLKTLLEAREIRKTFHGPRREIAALRGVSLCVQEGESVGIVGPSGSGKSTLARIIAGHLAPDAGQVLVEDAPLSTSWRKQARMVRRRIQLVLQDPWDALSPRLTVEQLVREPLDLLDGDGENRHQKVGEVLEDVGLPSSGGFLLARSHELSAGQLQRVALARALVAEPKLLVADEPTAMLDASEQARLLVTLRERQVEMGLGLVLISHDIAVVRKVTDRIVILDAGLIVEEGPSNLVSSSPRSPTGSRLVAAAPAFEIADENEDRRLVGEDGSG
ncbi:MAG: ABC transporter ATP-binding protein [Actinomycetota bacterium]|nr:ABC transporter ATP-binding protein [Actinomycetota bacterium]